MVRYNAAVANGLLRGIKDDILSTSGYVYFEFVNIPAAELANLKTFSVGGNTCYFSALNYAKAVLSSSAATDKQIELAKATYRYYVAAKAYFAAPVVNIVDLGTLTGDCEAQNGDVLTGALSGDL